MHVFTGEFRTQAEALSYGQWSYEAGPDNPRCGFSEEFGKLSFEADFLEAVWGDDRFEYLKGLLVDEADAALVQERQRTEDNTLMILMEIERNKNIRIPQSRSGKLRHCGRFDGCFRDL